MAQQSTFDPETSTPFLDAQNWHKEAYANYAQSHFNAFLTASKATLEAFQEATKAHAHYAEESLNELSKLCKNLTTPEGKESIYETQSQASQDSFNKAIFHNQKLINICQDWQTKLLNEFQTHLEETLKQASQFAKKSAD